jgi:hypothetical protein
MMHGYRHVTIYRHMLHWECKPSVSKVYEERGKERKEGLGYTTDSAIQEPSNLSRVSQRSELSWACVRNAQPRKRERKKEQATS